MKMELIEGSEMSAIRTQTPGNYPKENILLIEHGESLKSRTVISYWGKHGNLIIMTIMLANLQYKFFSYTLMFLVMEFFYTDTQ